MSDQYGFSSARNDFESGYFPTGAYGAAASYAGDKTYGAGYGSSSTAGGYNSSTQYGGYGGAAGGGGAGGYTSSSGFGGFGGSGAGGFTSGSGFGGFGNTAASYSATTTTRPVTTTQVLEERVISTMGTDTAEDYFGGGQAAVAAGQSSYGSNYTASFGGGREVAEYGGDGFFGAGPGSNIVTTVNQVVETVPLQTTTVTAPTLQTTNFAAPPVATTLTQTTQTVTNTFSPVKQDIPKETFNTATFTPPTPPPPLSTGYAGTEYTSFEDVPAPAAKPSLFSLRNILFGLGGLLLLGGLIGGLIGLIRHFKGASATSTLPSNLVAGALNASGPVNPSFITIVKPPPTPIIPPKPFSVITTPVVPTTTVGVPTLATNITVATPAPLPPTFSSNFTQQQLNSALMVALASGALRSNGTFVQSLRDSFRKFYTSDEEFERAMEAAIASGQLPRFAPNPVPVPVTTTVIATAPKPAVITSISSDGAISVPGQTSILVGGGQASGLPALTAQDVALLLAYVDQNGSIDNPALAQLGVSPAQYALILQNALNSNLITKTQFSRLAYNSAVAAAKPTLIGSITKAATTGFTGLNNILETISNTAMPVNNPNPLL